MLLCETCWGLTELLVRVTERAQNQNQLVECWWTCGFNGKLVWSYRLYSCKRAVLMPADAKMFSWTVILMVDGEVRCSLVELTFLYFRIRG